MLISPTILKQFVANIIKCRSLLFLALFQLTLTFHTLTNDCLDESGELCSQSWQPLGRLQLTLSTGSDQTSQKRDCFGSRAWPEEIKPEVGLMPAGAINLLFISNLLDHRRLFKRSLSVGESIFESNFDMSIIEDLLLLGWLLQWIQPVSCLD